MRQFNITVNGAAYQVSVEEVGATSAPVAPAAVAAPVAAAPVA
ncbi:MAG: acetyl-CoA carboxylase biotin carboxyl carrier protein subunit, partial [Clostridia bacterium]